MASTEQIAEISDSLATQSDLAARLLELLKNEYQALSHMDSEALLHTADEKQRLINALETLHEEFLELAQTIGSSVRDRVGMEKLIQRCDPDNTQGLNQVWQNLADTLAECQRQNEINGMVIVLGHQSIQNVLATLQGLPADHLVYDTSGQTRIPGTQNVIAKV